MYKERPEVEIWAFTHIWRLGFPTVSMETLVHAGHASLLFVLWKISENSYSTNLGQPRLADIDADGFKQALHEDIPPEEEAAAADEHLKVSYTLKLCFSSMKLVLVKKQNGVECYLHGFLWTLS